jgi:predicted dinucleotide-binding enzyme
MKIAMIGIGKVGGTLGTRWAQKGYTVTFGARDVNSEKVRALLETAGKNASAASVRDAAAGADVVVFAVPWPATQSAIEAAGDLTGKIVVDGTNPVAPGLQLALGTTTSGGEQVAQWAKGARVVKAFNTTGFENMANPLYNGEPTAMPICGDDADAKAKVGELAQALDFEPLDVGPLSAARFIEPFALVWIRLARAQGLGPNIAFKLARR